MTTFYESDKTYSAVSWNLYFSVHYIAKSVCTPTVVVSEVDNSVVNRGWNLPSFLWRLLSFGVGSQLSSGTLLVEFVSILPVAGRTVDELQLVVYARTVTDAPAHPKDVQWCRGRALGLLLKIFHIHVVKQRSYRPCFVNRCGVVLKQESAYFKLLVQNMKRGIVQNVSTGCGA